MQGKREGAAIPPRVRVLAEVLAAQVDLGVGRTRVELEFEDGILKIAHLHQRVPAGELARFDPERP